jgi:hypothetical protein
VSRCRFAIVVSQQHRTPGREPRDNKLGSERDGLLLVQGTGEQITGFSKKPDPLVLSTVVPIQPDRLQRRKHPGLPDEAASASYRSRLGAMGCGCDEIHVPLDSGGHVRWRLRQTDPSIVTDS